MHFTDVSVRLANGSIGEGRVELAVNGTFGTMCVPDSNTNAATVVCRMLGFYK